MDAITVFILVFLVVNHVISLLAFGFALYVFMGKPEEIKEPEIMFSSEEHIEEEKEKLVEAALSKQNGKINTFADFEKAFNGLYK